MIHSHFAIRRYIIRAFKKASLSNLRTKKIIAFICWYETCCSTRVQKWTELCNDKENINCRQVTESNFL